MFINPKKVGTGELRVLGDLNVTGNVYATGCFQLNNGTIIGGACISDAQFKNNIQDDDINISKMKSIKVKTFDWINETVKTGEEQYEECFETNVKEKKCKTETQCSWQLVGKYYQEVCSDVEICNDENKKTCDERIENQCEYEPKYDENNTLLGYEKKCKDITVYENCEDDVIETCETKTKDIFINLDSTPRGFIADEVQEIYPDRVVEENGVKKVIYGWDWIFDLWDGFQQHNDRITELEASVCLLTNNSEAFC